jgi:hypothetical protein
VKEDILKDLVADLRDFGANGFMLRAADEIERLREDLDSTIRKLRKVEADLDQARRQLCTELWLSRGQQCSVESIAEARGWNCFKEEP